MNRMHDKVATLYNTANKNHMKVNDSKTKTMVFNSSKKTDFEPVIETPEGKHLEYVCETKLLGTILTEDIKTIKKAHGCKNIQKNVDLKKISKSYVRQSRTN